MTDLVFVHNKRAVTDSLTVAEAFCKNHADVLRDVRNLGCSEEFRLSNFAESYYVNHQGRKMPRIILSEQGFTLLAMGYTGPKAMEFKERYIAEFGRMRQALQEQSKPRELTRLELIELARDSELARIEAEKKNAELEYQLRLQEPKVIFADAITTSPNSILIRELAVILKQNGIEIGEKRLFEWLRNNGYLIKRNGTDRNTPTQKSMELGLFEVKETPIVHSDGRISVGKTAKVTGKGQVYFVNRFKRELAKTQLPVTTP